MSLFTFIADLRGLRAEVKRCADALDRAYPLPAEAEPTEPEVTYVNEEEMALQEQRERASELEKWKAAHPEEAEEFEKLFRSHETGEDNVRS